MVECRRANVLYYMPRRDFSGGRTRSGMAPHTQRIAPRSAPVVLCDNHIQVTC
jgi:hypothetical protein